jgi:hypothetical protein
VECIRKEEEAGVIEVVSVLSGREGTLGVLQEVSHSPGVGKEGPFLLKDHEAGFRLSVWKRPRCKFLQLS